MKPDEEISPPNGIRPKKNNSIFRYHGKTDSTRSVPVSTLQPIYVAEPLEIVEGPHHGTLVLDGQPCAAFDYSQLLSRSVIYRHDGSETTQDQLEFQ
ncbi:hypothetical protein OSTOST_05917, partial [Ostertagia ostertagi]